MVYSFSRITFAGRLGTKRHRTKGKRGETTEHNENESRRYQISPTDVNPETAEF